MFRYIMQLITAAALFWAAVFAGVAYNMPRESAWQESRLDSFFYRADIFPGR